MNEIIVGLCESRHPLPVEEYIFPESVNPIDFDGMYKTVEEFLLTRVGIRQGFSSPLNSNDYTDIRCFLGERRLVGYVTGLTAATAAVIRACAYNGVELTLMHYDRESGQYVPQRIF